MLLLMVTLFCPLAVVSGRLLTAVRSVTTVPVFAPEAILVPTAVVEAILVPAAVVEAILVPAAAVEPVLVPVVLPEAVPAPAAEPDLTLLPEGLTPSADVLLDAVLLCVLIFLTVLV